MVDTDVTSPPLIKCHPSGSWTTWIDKWTCLIDFETDKLYIQFTIEGCLLNLHANDVIICTSADIVIYKKITESHWLDSEHIKYSHRQVINYKSGFFLLCFDLLDTYNNITTALLHLRFLVQLNSSRLNDGFFSQRPVMCKVFQSHNVITIILWLYYKTKRIFFTPHR